MVKGSDSVEGNAVQFGVQCDRKVSVEWACACHLDGAPEGDFHMGSNNGTLRIIAEPSPSSSTIWTKLGAQCIWWLTIFWRSICACLTLLMRKSMSSSPMQCRRANGFLPLDGTSLQSCPSHSMDFSVRWSASSVIAASQLGSSVTSVKELARLQTVLTARTICL